MYGTSYTFADNFRSRETSDGGLAVTQTGLAIAEKVRSL